MAKELNLPINTEEKERIHQNESVTLTTTFSKEQIAILEKASDLMSHTLPDHKWADLITALASKEIVRRTEIKNPVKNRNISELQIIDQMETPVGTTKTISIKPNIHAGRKAIHNKDKRCQFKDPLTNKTCGSVRFLEIDHIQAVWAGGNNSPSNLRVLCSQHNKFKYAKESGTHPLRW